LHSRIANEIDWYRGRQLRAGASGLLAAFDGPARAIRCACAIRDHASDLNIPFRAGLHTSECANAAGPSVSGSAVEAAILLQHRANIGEILTSGTVRDLATGSGLVFADAGLSQLPGFDNERQVLRVIGTSTRHGVQS
jgi:class 3 adenylate cyclase